MSKRLHGFTVFEMLVSMALLSIILLAVMQYLMSGLQVTRSVANQTTLQTDLRITGAMIADEIQRAIYVFPPCGEYGTTKDSSTLEISVITPVFDKKCDPVDTAKGHDPTKVRVTFSRINLGTATSKGTTLYNEGGNDNNKYRWQVGTSDLPVEDKNRSYPILMMIVAPRDSKVQCYSTTPPPAGSPAGTKDTGTVQRDGCYQFVAYYPVLRKYMTREYSPGSDKANPPLTYMQDESGKDEKEGGNAISAEQLEPNSSNQNQWVLMEYRRNLDRDIQATNLEVSATDNDKFKSQPESVGAGGASQNFDVPRINWGSAGCGQADGFTKPCPTGFITPNPDPSPENQATADSIPAIRRGTKEIGAIVSFRKRIAATKEWIEKDWKPGSGKILLDGLRPNQGFQVEFPNNSIDERGVNEVRVKLQMELDPGFKAVRIPAEPLEFFAVPRNISGL
jgi:prepilin-type N-terminal cleavage/methylation domain-containing protein